MQQDSPGRTTTAEARLVELERLLAEQGRARTHRGGGRRSRAIQWGIGVALATTPLVVMAVPDTPTYTFVPTQQIVADEVNTNFSELYAAVNALETAGGVDPACPSGYVHDAGRTDIVLCARGTDEIVKVGDFWIDRYEASAWSDDDCSGSQYGLVDDFPAGFPDTGHWSTPIYACSVVDVQPSLYLTWFQAQQACLLSGKHLATNAEWQAAVAGTFDPGVNDGSGNTNCNTDSANVRPTGGAGPTPGDGCVSNWGAEDMIANAPERTADWYVGGRAWMAGDNDTASAWPAGWGDDRTAGVDGRGYQQGLGFNLGSPTAAFRGGGWTEGIATGAFRFDIGYSPSGVDGYSGFRCARAR